MAHTGAMIALVPTVDDAQRLAVDGGEEPDQLHVTLMYLGEAALIPPEVRRKLVSCVKLALHGMPTAVGKIFSVNLFNPEPGQAITAGGGNEPCVVWGVDGELLSRTHKAICGHVKELLLGDGMTPHPQHEPWVAHITATYVDPEDEVDLTAFAGRVGPVTFDTVRLAFGDETFDLPLGDLAESYDDTPSEELQTMVAAGDVADCGCAETEVEVASGEVADVELSADGEPIVPNVLLDWRAWVTAQKEQDVNVPGPGHNLRNYWVRGPGAAKIRWGTDGSFARCVRNLSKYVARPQGLCAEYHKQATGEWPAEKGIPSAGETVAPDDDALYATTEAAIVEEVDTVTQPAEAAVDVTAADDPKKPYGDVAYADPGYQEDGIKRYPLDTETHVRAAWSYINMPKNAEKYSRADLRRVRARIAAAMRKLGVDVQAELDEDIVAAAVVGKKSVKDMDETYAPEVLSPEITPVSAAPWRGVLAVEGIESGDGRMFAPNSLTWDELPVPLRWQKESAHGGQNDVTVDIGNVDKIWREPADNGDASVFRIMGEGTIDLENPDGRRVFRRMKRGYMRGNSVDVDSVKDSNIELRFPEPPEGDEDAAVFQRPDLTTYKKGRIRATTMVSIPAFTEARLALVNVPDTAVPMADVEDVDVRAVGLVAATSVIEIVDAPPREWFDEPTDVTPQGALTVTPAGRVYGYVAPVGVRHRSFPGRDQYVPLGNVDYSRFMSGETIVADGGRVTTGRITMNCPHATTRRSLTASQANEHYENSCSIVATARIGENRNGVWIAGALLPDIAPATVQRIMACNLSGDWRAHLDRPGWREFVAALLVPVPGFPMARKAPSVEVADGQLVASSVPVVLATELPTELTAPADEPTVVEEPEAVVATSTRDAVAALGRRVHVARLRSAVAGVERR